MNVCVYIYIYICILCICVYIYIYIYILGMCISITEANTIHISMHRQRYDTLKINMKELAMRCDTIHSYYYAVLFDAIQHDAIVSYDF